MQCTIHILYVLVAFTSISKDSLETIILVLKDLWVRHYVVMQGTILQGSPIETATFSH